VTNNYFCFQANDFAAGLLALGLKPKDKLVVWGTNSTQWYLTLFACAKAGIVLVSVLDSRVLCCSTLKILLLANGQKIFFTKNLYQDKG
jgi:Acyl-CoA synthetases (AMP-forming)/AMP-acid ligases II